MDLQRTGSSRWSHFSRISWGAIFAGVAVGLAIQLLLTLFGIAAGLSAVDPLSSEPVGRVPVMTGVWTGISALVAAFVGGYVAARMSGFYLRSDGMLHGAVAWGVTTLAVVYLATTAVGAVLGGTFIILEQARGAAETTVSALAAASWWLFFGGLLSLLLGVLGGAAGVGLELQAREDEEIRRAA